MSYSKSLHELSTADATRKTWSSSDSDHDNEGYQTSCKGYESEQDYVSDILNDQGASESEMDNESVQNENDIANGFSVSKPGDYVDIVYENGDHTGESDNNRFSDNEHISNEVDNE